MIMEKPVRYQAALLGLLTIGLGIVAAQADKKDAGPQGVPLPEALQKARANGKYAMLYRQIKVAEDKEEGPEFREIGLQRMRRYKGHVDLPNGYWVYVYPYWYIWRDLTATPAAKRAWGPEQATGAPDTSAAGDFGTAWASLTPDGQDEWLLLEYGEPIVPRMVRIHETWNPGAVNKISMFRLDGREVEVWNGDDPTSSDSEKGVSEIKVKADFPTNRIKVHLDSKEFRGWNEIDAVGLVDDAGKTHWAAAAEASSTSASSNEQTLFQALVVTEQRVRNLELEVRKLREAMEELKKAKKDR